MVTGSIRMRRIVIYVQETKHCLSGKLPEKVLFKIDRCHPVELVGANKFVFVDDLKAFNDVSYCLNKRSGDVKDPLHSTVNINFDNQIKNTSWQQQSIAGVGGS